MNHKELNYNCVQIGLLLILIFNIGLSLIHQFLIHPLVDFNFNRNATFEFIGILLLLASIIFFAVNSFLISKYKVRSNKKYYTLFMTNFWLWGFAFAGYNYQLFKIILINESDFFLKKILIVLILAFIPFTLFMITRGFIHKLNHTIETENKQLRIQKISDNGSLKKMISIKGKIKNS